MQALSVEQMQLPGADYRMRPPAADENALPCLEPQVDFKRPENAVGFVVSILGTFSGVYLIQYGKKPADKEDAEAGGAAGERSAQVRLWFAG